MNPLVSDAFVDFLLRDVLEVDALCRLPAFEGHGPETVAAWLSACRRVAREVLYPAYREIDAEPPRFDQGRVTVHRRLHDAWRELTHLGVISAPRPIATGGQALPLTVAALSSAYLMAGNLAAYGFAGLTQGAAHLIEAFASDDVKAAFLEPLTSGTWAGTMALTEPQAGSSLADVVTRATPAHGHYLLAGSKIFISAGDHDLTENIVHLVLARIDGAPAGTKGLSLFAVPRLRREQAALVHNDVQVTQVIHKIGWRGLPSVGLALGEAGDCRGWLVGPANQGLSCMFQMMNEARLMVGLNATATASVAFHESLAYAKERRQGRALGSRGSDGPQLPIIEHADVRRMLLRQKAIVEGSLGLIGLVARYADWSEHALEASTRERSKLLLDLLTPIAKAFPSEWGFESNALALQIHGGYGYSSEYLPEAWLRDQKLNSIHEGTTTIQGLDLLGRKVVARQGAALLAFREEVSSVLARAQTQSFDCGELASALDALTDTALELGTRGANGDVEGMLAHSHDFLSLMSVVVLGWVWVQLALSATGSDSFAKGLRAAAQYWLATEVPRAHTLAKLCVSRERSYLDTLPEWL